MSLVRVNAKNKDASNSGKITKLQASLPNVFKAIDDQSQSYFAEIFGSGNNSGAINNLTSKLNQVIKGSGVPNDNDVSAYQDRMANLIKDDIMQRIAGLAKNNNPIIIQDIYNTINSLVDNFAKDNADNILMHCNSSNINNKDQLINNLTTIIRSKIDNRLNDELSKFNGNIMEYITTHTYQRTYEPDNPLNELSGVPSILVDSLFRDIGTFTTETVSGLLDVATFSAQNILDENNNTVSLSKEEVMQNFCSTMGNNFYNIFENLKDNAINSIINVISNGVNNIASILNNNINSCFTEPLNLIEDVNQYLGVFNSITGENFQIPNLATQAQNYLNGKMSNVANRANNSVNNLKQNLSRETKNKAANIQQEAVKHTNNRPGASNKNTQNQVQNRNSNDNGQTNKNNNKPKPGQYDNTKPKPANIKSKDPRRKNTQELVFWEKPGEEYILVRDAKGNYLLLDEAKNNIRLQHTSGSYIELRSSGDIMIEAAHFVYINTVGSNYIERF